MALVAWLALPAVVAGCGGSDASSVPTANELASSLLAVGDLPGTWSVNLGPGDEAVAASGVVAEDQQEMLPRVELCDKASAASRAAADGLRWKAFRQLDLTAQDPVDPPSDVVGHLAFVQEFLTAGEPGAITTTFDALRAGAQACMGAMPAGEEGPGTMSDLAVPSLGDDRFGVLTVVQEAGGGAEWILQNVIVRKGPVLLVLDVVDIRMGGVEPLYDDAAAGEMARTAVNKL